MRVQTPALFVTTLGTLTLMCSPIWADDVEVQLGAGDGFVVKDNTGTIERLRVDEDTGNVSVHSYVEGTPILEMWYPTSSDGGSTSDGDGFWDWDQQQYNTNASAFTWAAGRDTITVRGSSFPGY